MAIRTVVATVNGQQYTLTYNASTGKYEATITAPSASSWSQDEHKYGVTLTATDVAGNSTTIDRTDATFGDDLKLRVLEKDAPTITELSPSSGSYITDNKPTVTFKLSDTESGVDTTTTVLKINGTTVPVADITFTAVSGGYTGSYTIPTALSEGSNTISVSVSDNDGNTAATVSSTFTVDTVNPELNVTTPEDNLITNVAACTVAGTTNDVTSTPVTIAITLNGADQGNVTVDNTGAFSKVITLANGSNTIVITATDAAGRTTTVTRTVILDTAAPVFTAVSIVPNPVDCGATYVISVTVTDA